MESNQKIVHSWGELLNSFTDRNNAKEKSINVKVSTKSMLQNILKQLEKASYRHKFNVKPVQCCNKRHIL